jgi:hypothetical protein
MIEQLEQQLHIIKNSAFSFRSGSNSVQTSTQEQIDSLHACMKLNGMQISAPTKPFDNV